MDNLLSRWCWVHAQFIVVALVILRYKLLLRLSKDQKSENPNQTLMQNEYLPQLTI
jgi:hypothetical protein